MTAELYLIGHREVKHRPGLSGDPLFEDLKMPFDYHKIGIAEDVQQRLSSMSTGTPHELELITTIQCDDPQSVEDTLHSINYHSRKRGEWFRLQRNMVNSLIAIDHLQAENVEAVHRHQLSQGFDHRMSLYIQLMRVRNGEIRVSDVGQSSA